MVYLSGNAGTTVPSTIPTTKKRKEMEKYNMRNRQLIPLKNYTLFFLPEVTKDNNEIKVHKSTNSKKNTGEDNSYKILKAKKEKDMQ